ncbi:hypothetical protein KCTC32516_00243 [Polaribacter huanghezhanensis]|uniref:DUF5723 family protein n=1 Tax=Polaribacter huanghezhanensis TaxID=1354726 RepID=UPI002647D124|nr:DUF5723 family protein [Polaribacter huanghezhanensis]WKD84907.1 hypothetical protein KCTC32516_00243 [Polaribacter huanghezhanensis]
MNFRKLFIVLGVLISCLGYSQNKQLLYGFAEMPNTLMVNPGAETNFRFHAGIPFLSGLLFSVGSSKAKISDLFLTDNIGFTSKFRDLIGKLTERDFIDFNSTVEILNGGYRLNEKMYLSFGLYQEMDFIGYFPNDLANLAYYGNGLNINKTVHLSQLRFRGDILGVIHAGLSYKVNKRLNIGGRFKIYSGSVHVSSQNNTGTFTTVEGVDNIYRHYFSNININFNSSGMLDENNKISIGLKDAIGNTFLSKNIGVGIDVGFTYHYTPQIEFTGSILDIGFISYSKNVKNLSLVGSHQFNGVKVLFDEANKDYWSVINKDYLAEIDSEFRKNIPGTSNSNSFISWRPIKFNGAVRYSYGRARSNKECYDETYKEYYNNSVGLQLYAITRPLSTQIAATLFFEKSIGEKINAKFTYTADDYSFTNVGVGVSTQIGKFHMYGLLNNVLKLSDLANAKSASLQFGFNLIFD